MSANCFSFWGLVLQTANRGFPLDPTTGTPDPLRNSPQMKTFGATTIARATWTHAPLRFEKFFKSFEVVLCTVPPALT